MKNRLFYTKIALLVVIYGTAHSAMLPEEHPIEHPSLMQRLLNNKPMQFIASAAAGLAVSAAIVTTCGQKHALPIINNLSLTASPPSESHIMHDVDTYLALSGRIALNLSSIKDEDLPQLDNKVIKHIDNAAITAIAIDSSTTAYVHRSIGQIVECLSNPALAFIFGYGASYASRACLNYALNSSKIRSSYPLISHPITGKYDLFTASLAAYIATLAAARSRNGMSTRNIIRYSIFDGTNIITSIRPSPSTWWESCEINLLTWIQDYIPTPWLMRYGLEFGRSAYTLWSLYKSKDEISQLPTSIQAVIGLSSCALLAHMALLPYMHAKIEDHAREAQEAFQVAQD